MLLFSLKLQNGDKVLETSIIQIELLMQIWEGKRHAGNRQTGRAHKANWVFMQLLRMRPPKNHSCLSWLLMVLQGYRGDSLSLPLSVWGFPWFDPTAEDRTTGAAQHPSLGNLSTSPWAQRYGCPSMRISRQLTLHDGSRFKIRFSKIQGRSCKVP